MPPIASPARRQRRIEQLQKKDLLLAGKIDQLQRGRAEVARELADLETQSLEQPAAAVTD